MRELYDSSGAAKSISRRCCVLWQWQWLIVIIDVFFCHCVAISGGGMTGL